MLFRHSGKLSFFEVNPNITTFFRIKLLVFEFLFELFRLGPHSYSDNEIVDPPCRFRGWKCERCCDSQDAKQDPKTGRKNYNSVIPKGGIYYRDGRHAKVGALGGGDRDRAVCCWRWYCAPQLFESVHPWASGMRCR
jgi:hypothetical protein